VEVVARAREASAPLPSATVTMGSEAVIANEAIVGSEAVVSIAAEVTACSAVIADASSEASGLLL
jgi:hypothetical protein